MTMQTDVYNLNNQKVGTVELPENVFGAKWNEPLVKQVLEAQNANARTPWAHTKTRGEVRGGGKKPWRQKGTGRARHGSIRSPLWIGGGKAHGPRNERDYSQKVNKKMKRVALFAVLSRKAKDGELKIFENFVLAAPKTKVLASTLRALLSMNAKKTEKRYDVLFVAEAGNKNLARASANLQKTKALDATSLNVEDVLNHKNLFIEKDAVATIAKHYKI
ncbi:MAG TPA: 50S ribosomal protein L4 [Candidatus Paceibacterota bacterium]|jgi:large subunit ribosomal protein L4|nr:50S ribosomal protein L4 [Candidatus Paceibacterota bacterium]